MIAVVVDRRRADAGLIAFDDSRLLVADQQPRSAPVPGTARTRCA